MSMHIGAPEGAFADKIVLPGDPLRAKYIAETYLTDAFLVNEVRGILGFTGFYKGEKVSVMGTGMGVPAMLIYATELIRDYGVKKLVRTGTAGAFDPSFEIGDIILSQACSTNSAINDHILPGHLALIADFGLLCTAYKLAKDKGLNVHVGNTMCNDMMYIDNKPDYARKWLEYGVVASEMEAAGLYTVANRYRAKSLTMATIGSSLLGQNKKSLSQEEKEKNLNDMIELALETLITPDSF